MSWRLADERAGGGDTGGDETSRRLERLERRLDALPAAGALMPVVDDLVPELTISLQAAVVAVGEELSREVQARMAVLARDVEAAHSHVAQLADTLRAELRDLVSRRADETTRLELGEQRQAALVSELMARISEVAAEVSAIRHRIG